MQSRQWHFARKLKNCRLFATNSQHDRTRQAGMVQVVGVRLLAFAVSTAREWRESPGDQAAGPWSI